MKKFISRHKIIFLALITALSVVFFYAPFIVLTPHTDIFPGGARVEPCSNTYTGMLCTLNAPVSLYIYLQSREPIISINWEVPFIAFSIAFAFIYGELKLIVYVMKFRNIKHKITLLILKILAIAVIVFIPLFIFYLILGFFGLNLSLNF